MSSPPQDLTTLLNLAVQGDEEASRQVMPHVYEELRRIARWRMAHLAAGHTLQPTALVNEAWMQIAPNQGVTWEGRRHFFFVAARAMKDILLKHARAKNADKRGGQRERVELRDEDLAIEAPVDDMIALDEALSRLYDVDEEGHQLVMLKFFAGLTMDEMADVMRRPKRTLERRWRFVRVWLHQEAGLAVS